MSGQANPHDAVFRRVLGEPVNAASQLRAVLPPGLADRLDLGRLTRVSGSFVDASLRWRHSDLLFTAPLDGHDAFVYVLIEHQSSTDTLMPFRMLRYMIRVWDEHLDRNPQATCLPAIIPLVVHHNRRPWAGPTELADLFHLDSYAAKAAEPYLPRFEFLLDDLARVDEATLRARPLTPPARLTVLLLKIAAGNPHLADDLRSWTDDLHAVLDRPGGIDTFIALVKYIETVAETPADELHDLFTYLGPRAEEAYMTTADMLRAEGEARGRAEALVQLLTLRFGPLPPAVVGTVHAASTGQLECWTGRVLTADILDDIFS